MTDHSVDEVENDIDTDVIVNQGSRHELSRGDSKLGFSPHSMLSLPSKPLASLSKHQSKHLPVQFVFHDSRAAKK